VTATRSSAPPIEGRVSRVVIFGLLAAGWGADLFENVSDPWLTVPRFLLTTAGTSVLVWELTKQAHRGAGAAVTRWTGSDTAIAAVLGGYSGLLIATMILRHPPRHESTSAAAFASLYLALDAYFVWRRRRTLATCTPA
jgi:uncharacterized membrane protein YsdA (DUF1294 family)